MQVCVGNCRVFHLEPIATKNRGTLLSFFSGSKARPRLFFNNGFNELPFFSKKSSVTANIEFAGTYVLFPPAPGLFLQKILKV